MSDTELTPEQQAKFDAYKALIEARKPKVREPEIYGDVTLDVQANSDVFCQPRKNGIPLKDYSHYQVKILREETDDEGNTEVKAYKPSVVRGSMKELDKYFNSDGLGAEVPKEAVHRIRENLVREIDSVDDIEMPEDWLERGLPIKIIAKVKIAREIE